MVVGRTTVGFVDEARGARRLETEIWYPAREGCTGEAAIYRFAERYCTASTVTLEQAPVADGRFPLLVFSHGNANDRLGAALLCERIASMGIIVAAPDHAGNTTTDVTAGRGVSVQQTLTDRPSDIRAVIDRLAGGSDGHAFAASIADHQVGVAGVSAGAVAALLIAANDQPSMTNFPVRAIAAIAPVTWFLDERVLARIKVPTLLIGGTRDASAKIEPDIVRAYELITATDVRRVDILDAGHLSFSGTCLLAKDFLADPKADAGFVSMLCERGCGADFINPQLAMVLTARYVTAFFQRHLRGDLEAETELVSVEGASVMSRTASQAP